MAYVEFCSLFKQPDLAHTLELIATQGADGFYKGEVAQKIADAVLVADGVITTDDMAVYKSVKRETIQGTYCGYDIHLMPPLARVARILYKS